MWPYWLMFLLPLVAVGSGLRTPDQRLGWLIVLCTMGLMIGLRYHVGGDWGNYLRHFDRILGYSLSEVMFRGDPGYYSLNWMVAKAGFSIIWVNLVCGFIVMRGIHSFCGYQPLPWLALLVAVPYLIIVVSMGYSRQAAALGFVMLALTVLAKHEIRKFVFWVVLGALFHKSAVLMLPLAALSATKNRVSTIFWVGVMAFGAAYFIVFDSAELLYTNYVVAEYANASQGGAIRVAMNSVPALIFLKYRKKLCFNATEMKVWIWISIFSLICIPLLSFSATAVDRVALYFIPIQMFVFSRLPFIFKDRKVFDLIVWGVVIYYALVQFVWLNFAANSFRWLPYKMFFW